MNIKPAWILVSLLLLAPAVTPAATVFEHVNVLPMDSERVLEDQTVVVSGGRIVALGPAGSVGAPDGAVKIDGKGKYLLPGLAEMHAHIPPPGAGDESIDRVLALCLLNGVTTIRGMIGDPSHLALRAEVASGDRFGPRIFTAGPSLNGNSVPTVEVALESVTRQKAAGYDLLKLHPGLTREVFDAIADTAAREGILFAGHVSTDVGLSATLRGRQSSIEHLDGYVEALVPSGAADSGQSIFFGLNLVDRIDEGGIPALAAATRAVGAWVTPTQVLLENRFLAGSPDELRGRPELRYVPAETIEQWIGAIEQVRQLDGITAEAMTRLIEIRRRVIRALQAAGAGLLLGADSPQVFNVPGFATLQELESLVAAGLTPYQALRTGTVNPAVYFGLEGSFGTVETGKRADLILVEANPLQEIGNIRRLAGVMAAGRWIPGAEIRERLAALERKGS